jgi:general stress protein 26
MINIENSKTPLSEIVGLAESFRKSKIVFMITYGESGEEHSRAMTNLNENPYGVMWFPTATSTRKVDDIKKNKKVLLLFPSPDGEWYYELEGEGSFATRGEVEEKWIWWWLYWHPHQAERYWEPQRDGHPERTIVKLRPVSARLLHGSKAEDMKKSMPKF